MIIPIGVTAKNEALNLPLFLKSLRRSVLFATRRLPAQFEIHVLLNDNSDQSAKILEQEQDLQVWHTFGGLVEAQRFLKNLKPDAPFLIYSDADILLEENCIFQLTQSMLKDVKLQITYAEKFPLAPKAKTFLSRALHLYNLNNGYQNHRHYFNGQLFAIRDWSIPRPTELKWTQSQNNRFLNLEAGIRCDDIFLSRDILKRFGPENIHCAQAKLWYRPPETLQGMYRKYQRMRLEIERLNLFFPETVSIHERWGRRRLQKKVIFSRPMSEIFYYFLFLAALTLCKLYYRFERSYYGHFSRRYCETWKPIAETKDLS